MSLLTRSEDDIIPQIYFLRGHRVMFDYHLAEIYKANNMLEKVAPIKKELMNSLFELGPNYEQKIRNL